MSRRRTPRREPGRAGQPGQRQRAPGATQEPDARLVAEYEPSALFSLKASFATRSVGKTLVVATPYAVKMAFVDAAFRAKLSDADCADLVRALANVDVRIAPPEAAVVTHTFVKVRQESREGDPLRPYIPSIAYREVVHQRGLWRWAFGIGSGNDALSGRLELLAPFVTYIGKRGSFVQFRRLVREASLGPGFTQPVQNRTAWTLPPRGVHVVALDDFGPEADMETLSSFTAKTPTRDRHRRFIETVVPIGLVNTGPGFSEYRRGNLAPEKH